MKSPRIELYRDRKNEHRWRLRAANGRIIAESGEGYVLQSKARLGARKAAAMLVQAEFVEVDAA